MSEMSFEQLLEASLKTIRTGEVVEGTVIDVKEDEIILNIGYKADGIIPARFPYAVEITLRLDARYTEIIKRRNDAAHGKADIACLPALGKFARGHDHVIDRKYHGSVLHHQSEMVGDACADAPEKFRPKEVHHILVSFVGSVIHVFAPCAADAVAAVRRGRHPFKELHKTFSFGGVWFSFKQR